MHFKLGKPNKSREAWVSLQDATARQPAISPPLSWGAGEQELPDLSSNSTCGQGSEDSSALHCHQPVRQTAKELGRKEIREASNRKNIPLENFWPTLIMGLLSESVMMLAEDKETHCIFCVVTGFLYKSLSIPDTQHQLKQSLWRMFINPFKPLHSKWHCFCWEWWQWLIGTIQKVAFSLVRSLLL